MADILKNFDKVKTQFKIILFQTKQNKEKSKKNNSKSLDSEDTEKCQDQKPIRCRCFYSKEPRPVKKRAKSSINDIIELD